MKARNSASPFYGLPHLFPPPPPLPPLAAANIGNNVGNLSKSMSNFAYWHSFDYRGYPYDFSLPEDLYQEDNQMPEFDHSIIDDLGDSYENCYPHQDYWYNDHEIDFNGFHSALKFYQPYDQTNSEENYDRISQVLSPNDFDNDSAEGEECIGKGYYSEEDTLHEEANNFGSYFGRSKNSNLMEKDDLAPSLCRSERRKQPVQEENYSYPNWSYGEQLKVELQQDISSLTAYVGRLEIQVEHLTLQVQDMANKLADETTESKLFIETEDSIHKPDENGWTDDDSSSSASD